MQLNKLIKVVVFVAGFLISSMAFSKNVDSPICEGANPFPDQASQEEIQYVLKHSHAQRFEFWIKLYKNSCEEKNGNFEVFKVKDGKLGEVQATCTIKQDNDPGNDRVSVKHYGFTSKGALFVRDNFNECVKTIGFSGELKHI